ncbi:phospholipase [Acinetobacter chinensis]|uniref:Phospholipase A1 n=1 Tax=Acinetobacter chinensis TaxID=2004650 RepID=A0A3B7LUQ3_9GAMM|nr:phospholipase A [Acinetobacter chinensis]AXY56582.1 phospholipase [Acinetobacter chinensis]
MAFTRFGRTALNLSICLLGTASTAYAQEQPASAAACAALDSNPDRLACYDALFKVPDPIRPQLVSEREAALDIKPAPTQPETVKEKIRHGVDNLFAVEGPKIDPNTSLLDKRWELSPESKLGTWNIRAYQPVYLLPAFWTNDKNELPHSPNPTNTVDQEQNLKSMEAKFQLSLKTKAVENLFGNNGDVWVGYTQSSRWQVYNSDESRPFRETNYEPEASLVFRTNYEVLGLNARLLGLTLNHQSNGRSDPLSRSWNRVMLNLGFERNNFALMLRPWYRMEEDFKDDNNPDIKDYVGRGDMTAFYRWNEHEFSLMLRHSLKGGDDAHGAAQFDWAFPISGKLRGHFQLFDGYGESLIDYNHRATYVGLGVSLMNWF